MSRQPSTCTEGFWLSVRKKPVRLGWRVGKWLMWVPVSEVDGMWEKVKKALKSGKLGCGAKVATARPHPRAKSPDERVLCIYTRDWQDVEDVFRVREGLRELGVTWKIPYKTDADTLAGRYSGSGHGRVSKYFA